MYIYYIICIFILYHSVFIFINYITVYLYSSGSQVVADQKTDRVRLINLATGMVRPPHLPPPTLNHQPSTLNPQPSTPNPPP